MMDAFRAVLLSVAVSVAIPGVPAQGAPGRGIPQASAEEKADIVREFRRYFRKFKQVAERVEAVRTLERAESVEAVAELVPLLEHKLPEVAKAALEVLAGFGQRTTFGPLVEELPDLKNPRRALVIEVLGRAGVREAMPVIADIALHDRKADDAVRYRAARVAGMIGDDSSAPLLEALLGSSNGLVRMAAADSIGALRIKPLGGQLIGLVVDENWQVQVAAVQALGRVREAEAIEPLIAEMRKGGRLQEECADALFRITGMDFGMDPDSWEKTWTNLKSIPGWRIPTDEELAAKARNRKRYDALYGTADAPSFGGIKTSSTKLLFIIDVSGSMKDLVVQREKFDSGYDDFEKLTIVKTELSRTIDALGPNTLFNIVAFARDLKPWKRFLAPANVVNKASARAFVRKLQPIGPQASGPPGSGAVAAGKTNTFKALMYPFGIDPAGRTKQPKDAALRNKVDTVFFLSDGRPTTGKFVDTNEILDEVGSINTEFRIVLHTIAIGEFQKNFLKSLAERNGGTFVDLGY